MASRTDQYIAVSHSVLLIAQQQDKLDNAKICVVYNGMSARKEQFESRDNIRKRLGLNHADIVIATVSPPRTREECLPFGQYVPN